MPDKPDVTIEVMVDDSWQRPSNDAEIIDQAASIRDLTGRDVPVPEPATGQSWQ